MKKLSPYKNFVYQLTKKNKELVCKVSALSESKAFQHLLQKFGGKKSGWVIQLLSCQEVFYEAGEKLTYIGKESQQWNKVDDFIYGKEYEVQKSGNTLFVESESGRQEVDINPKLFKKENEI